MTELRKRKGIILAGGLGTRLYPLTLTTSKQLLPVHDKPMIYYPLSILMRLGIRDVLIITNTGHEHIYYKLFGNGSVLGLNISYIGQKEPKGIPDAFILGKKFIGDDPVCLILGDNLFFGNFAQQLLVAMQYTMGSVLVYKVRNPSAYGVYHANTKTILEKPKNTTSPWAVTGLYFYENDVIEIAKNLKPSARGELEITDVNQTYLDQGKLMVQYLPEGVVWLDAGSHEALADATALVRTIEARQGFKIGCVEQIAWQFKWISDHQLAQRAEQLKGSYGEYLKGLLNDHRPNNQKVEKDTQTREL